MFQKNADISRAIDNMIPVCCIVIMFNRCIVLEKYTATKYKNEK